MNTITVSMGQPHGTYVVRFKLASGRHCTRYSTDEGEAAALAIDATNQCNGAYIILGNSRVLKHIPQNLLRRN